MSVSRHACCQQLGVGSFFRGAWLCWGGVVRVWADYPGSRPDPGIPSGCFRQASGIPPGPSGRFRAPFRGASQSLSDVFGALQDLSGRPRGVSGSLPEPSRVPTAPGTFVDPSGNGPGALRTASGSLPGGLQELSGSSR